MKRLLLLLVLIIFPFNQIFALSVNDKAPDFNLPKIKGSGSLSLSELKGKIVLLVIWTSWCGVCRKQLPEMISLKNYFEPKGFEIVAVNIDDTIDTAARYIQNLEMKNGVTNFYILYDREKKIANDYTTNGIPNNFIIGRDGTLLKVIRGGFGPSNIGELYEMLELIIGTDKSNTQINNENLQSVTKKENIMIDENKFIISGGIVEKKILTNTFNLASKKLYNCYKDEKIKNPLIKGTILVRFIVSENGKVKETSIEQSYINNKAIEDCIQTIIKKLNFPPPNGGQASISYPLEFE